jgi:hypothetical protein
MNEGSAGDEGSESASGSVPESGVGSGPDRGSGPEIDPAVAATAREELRTTFTYQVERLREIDTKAIEILKANLVLIGIVVTGGSIVVQTEFDLGGFLNPFTFGGGILLLVSTGLAAVTYTASDLRGGLSIADVDAVIAAEHGRTRPEEAGGDGARDRPPGFDERLLRSYAEWIDYNARVTAVNDLLATVTVLLVFLAFVYVVAGVAVGAAGLSPAESWLSFAVLTALGGGFTWIAAHMDHLGPETRHAAASFDGVQLSKGADRSEAWSSLWAMLGREPPDASLEEPFRPSEKTGDAEGGDGDRGGE